MPSIGGPGQHATPSATRAMPATRATGMATPVNDSPSNNFPTSAGTISSANPVAASATAAQTNSHFMATPPPRISLSDVLTSLLALRCVNRTRLRCCHRPQFCPGLRFWLGLRFELEGQLVDLAGELKGNIVA